MGRPWLCALLLAGPACGGSLGSEGERQQPIDAGSGTDDGALDPDGDGLCNDTEANLGTDPDNADTDKDNLPDLFEAVFGLDPLSNQSPEPNALVYLESNPGAAQSFEVRTTVDGSGSDYAGYFLSASALFDDGRSAANYLVSSTALGAVPPDNVREIDTTDQIFQGVSGTTRLRFQLDFEFSEDEALSCAIPLLFQYVVVDDSGALTNTSPYLLVLAPDGSIAGPEEFCPTSGCF